MAPTPNNMPRGRTVPTKSAPWASEMDFDPQRAWQLICNLRAEVARLRAECHRLRIGEG